VRARGSVVTLNPTVKLEIPELPNSYGGGVMEKFGHLLEKIIHVGRLTLFSKLTAVESYGFLERSLTCKIS